MAVLNIGSGELDTTIGDAIAVVQDRDIIEVHAGTYINDHVSVSKHITVKYVALRCGFAAVAIAGGQHGEPAAALVIKPSFDSSITSLANAGTITAAFNTVAQDFASQFTANAQVNVRVSWGSVGGDSLPSNAVGASNTSLYGYFTYNQVKSLLTTAAQKNPSSTALATAAANLPATAPTGVIQYVVPSSEAKTLGLISPTQTSFDGSVGFAGSTSSYDFDPTNGVAVGTYDFRAVVAHELDEVLGHISGLYSTAPTYRQCSICSATSLQANRVMSYYDAAYFSIDGGKTRLGSFNNASTGDRAELADPVHDQTDIQDAFIATGQ